MIKAIRTLQLSRLLPAIRDQFGQVKDKRKQDASALGFPISDVLMSGLALMFLQDPSLLEFQRRLLERRHSCNLKTIFGVEDVPKASQFRRILDPADPDQVQKGFSLAFSDCKRLACGKVSGCWVEGMLF